MCQCRTHFSCIDTVRYEAEPANQFEGCSNQLKDINCLETNEKAAFSNFENAARLEQFALPFAREERISLAKMLFSTRQNLQTTSKDALVDSSS